MDILTVNQLTEFAYNPWRRKIIKYFLNLKNLLYIHSWAMMRTPMFGKVMVEFGERSNYRDKRVEALTYQS